MFWNSLLAGLKVLMFWETYVAGLMYLAISFFPIIIAFIISNINEETGFGFGCLAMLIQPLFHVMALLVVLMTLTPIITGLSNDAEWALPWLCLIKAPIIFVVVVGVLTIVAVVLSFIPIVSRILPTLCVGGFAIIFTLPSMERLYSVTINGYVEFMPSFWFLIGLIVVGGLMSVIGIGVAVFFVTMVITDEDLAGLLMPPIGAVFGLFPVFMYGGWLGAQIPS
ncbi:hypothetical protein ACFL43_02335 [Thermodesulfobacteriota bacterium]